MLLYNSALWIAFIELVISQISDSYHWKGLGMKTATTSHTS